MIFSCHLLICLVVIWEKKLWFPWGETIRKIRLNWQKFSISLMENRQKIASHPTELSLFPWELTDRKITKTHKEISNIPDSKPTGKSINLTVADNVLDLMTLFFFVTHRSKKYRQENISVGRLTGKFYFSVNPSLTGYACRAPGIIKFSDCFPTFLMVFWHTGKMVFPVVYALLCMLFSQNITYAIVQILNILHCAPCNDPNSLHPR